MLNKAMIIGRLGKDPESKSSQSGKQICSFTVATDSGYGDNKKTDWHSIVCFDKCAENCAKYLKKGSQVYVEGRISYDKYTDKNGVEKYMTRIIANTVDFLARQEKAPVADDPNANPFLDDKKPKHADFSNDVFDDVPF